MKHPRHQNTKVRITSNGRTQVCGLIEFGLELLDYPDMLLELCSKGMVVVGGGAAPVFNIELVR